MQAVFLLIIPWYGLQIHKYFCEHKGNGSRPLKKWGTGPGSFRRRVFVSTVISVAALFHLFSGQAQKNLVQYDFSGHDIHLFFALAQKIPSHLNFSGLGATSCSNIGQIWSKVFHFLRGYSSLRHVYPICRQQKLSRSQDRDAKYKWKNCKAN